MHACAEIIGMNAMNKYEEIKDLFGKFSSNYDQHMFTTNHTNAQKQTLNKIKEFIGANICEIACGTATISKFIIETGFAKTITLIDYQADMLKLAETKLSPNPNLKFLNMDVHELHKLNLEFDTIICSFGFYWFENPQTVIANIKQKLKKGGCVILLEENFFANCETLPIFAQGNDDLKRLGALENYLGIENIKKMFLAQNLVCLHEHRVAIDEKHEIVGMVITHKDEAT